MDGVTGHAGKFVPLVIENIIVWFLLLERDTNEVLPVPVDVQISRKRA